MNGLKDWLHLNDPEAQLTKGQPYQGSESNSMPKMMIVLSGPSFLSGLTGRSALFPFFFELFVSLILA